jgi:hypothetical protein
MWLFQDIRLIEKYPNEDSGNPGFHKAKMFQKNRIITRSGKSGMPGREYKPFFAPLVQKRRIALILLIAVTLQTLLISVGMRGWQCPIYSSIGIPCPGCGLSTAITLIIKGDWQGAIHTHAFAPVFLFTFLLMGIISILPENLHRKAVLQITTVEKHTAFAAYTLSGMIIYWIYRVSIPYF